MSNPQQLIQKVWNYCNILPPARGFGATCRDDGLSFRLRGATARRDGDLIATLPDFSRFFQKAAGLDLYQVHSGPLKPRVYAENANPGTRCEFLSIYFQILSITGALT